MNVPPKAEKIHPNPTQIHLKTDYEAKHVKAGHRYLHQTKHFT